MLRASTSRRPRGDWRWPPTTRVVTARHPFSDCRRMARNVVPCGGFPHQGFCSRPRKPCKRVPLPPRHPSTECTVSGFRAPPTIGGRIFSATLDESVGRSGVYDPVHRLDFSSRTRSMIINARWLSGAGFQGSPGCRVGRRFSRRSGFCFFAEAAMPIETRRVK